MESYWIWLAVIDANMGHGIGRIVEEKIVERIGVLLLFFFASLFAGINDPRFMQGFGCIFTRRSNIQKDWGKDTILRISQEWVSDEYLINTMFWSLIQFIKLPLPHDFPRKQVRSASIWAKVFLPIFFDYQYAPRRYNIFTIVA